MSKTKVLFITILDIIGIFGFTYIAQEVYTPNFTLSTSCLHNKLFIFVLIHLFSIVFIYLVLKLRTNLHLFLTTKTIIVALVLINKYALMPTKDYIILYSMLCSCVVLGGFVLLSINDNKELSIRLCLLVYVKTLLAHLFLIILVSEPSKELFANLFSLLILFDKELIKLIITFFHNKLIYVIPLRKDIISAISTWSSNREIRTKGVILASFADRSNTQLNTDGAINNPGPSTASGANNLDYLTNTVFGLYPTQISSLANRLQTSVNNILADRGWPAFGTSATGIKLSEAIKGMNPKITWGERRFLKSYCFHKLGWQVENNAYLQRIISGGINQVDVIDAMRNIDET